MCHYDMSKIVNFNISHLLNYSQSLTIVRILRAVVLPTLLIGSARILRAEVPPTSTYPPGQGSTRILQIEVPPTSTYPPG